MALNCLENNIAREKHDFNSSKLYKELLYKSKVTIDTFYNNYGSQRDIINASNHKGTERVFIMVNDINIYQ